MSAAAFTFGGMSGGLVIGAVASLLAIFGAVITARRAMTSIWKDNFEGERIAREEAEARAHELEVENARLQRATDLTDHQAKMMQLNTSLAGQIIAAIEVSEERTDRLLTKIAETQNQQAALIASIVGTVRSAA